MERFFNREFTFDRIARMFVLTIIVLLILWGVRAIWGVLLPFLLAGIFAYVVMPLVRFFQYTLRLHSDAGGNRCIDLPSYHLRGTLCEGGGREDPADDLQL